MVSSEKQRVVEKYFFFVSTDNQYNLHVCLLLRQQFHYIITLHFVQSLSRLNLSLPSISLDSLRCLDPASQDQDLQADQPIIFQYCFSFCFNQRQNTTSNFHVYNFRFDGILEPRLDFHSYTRLLLQVLNCRLNHKTPVQMPQKNIPYNNSYGGNTFRCFNNKSIHR
jgi:hypothetical protein